MKKIKNELRNLKDAVMERPIWSLTCAIVCGLVVTLLCLDATSPEAVSPWFRGAVIAITGFYIGGCVWYRRSK